MDSTLAIQKIINDIKEFDAKGVSMIETKQLINYLESKSEQLKDGTMTEAQIEEYKAIVAGKLAHSHWRNNFHLETFRSVLTSGQNALKAGMLLHGGASLALLTFIGHLVTRPETQPLVTRFAPIMTCFLVGVLISVVCHGVTYACQFCYQRDWYIPGHILNVISNASSLFGYGLFGWACYLSYNALMDISTYYMYI